MKKLSTIKVIIWDFDGTFYPPNDALWHDIREAEYRTIELHTGWGREKVVDEFTKYHKKITPSATQTVARLCGITTTQATTEFETYFDRRKYLHKDIRLIELFQKLTRFSHYILANGSKKGISESLEALGIAKAVFTQIITSETVGVTKPDLKGFLYILGKTGLKPDQHLMVGDREKVDLVPAKQLGMKTCLVWADKKSDIADIVIPTVYDLYSAII